MSDDAARPPDLVIPSHPQATQIVHGYTTGQVIQFSDGQHFVIGHFGDVALLLVPITDADAERVCGSDVPTTSASSMT